MPKLTAEQRYAQAVKRARLIGRRDLRDMMAGRRDWARCVADLERESLIRELDLAYEAGRAALKEAGHG